MYLLINFKLRNLNLNYFRLYPRCYSPWPRSIVIISQRGLMIMRLTIAFVLFRCESEIDANLSISIPGGSALLWFLLAIHSGGITHGFTAFAAVRQHQLELSSAIAVFASWYPIRYEAPNVEVVFALADFGRMTRFDHLALTSTFSSVGIDLMNWAASPSTVNESSLTFSLRNVGDPAK